MKWYNLKIKDIFKELDTLESGLNTNEAKLRLSKNGQNKLLEATKESNFKKFLNEFKDVMILVLIIAAVISFVVSIINHESFIDSIIIIAIVILNAVLGFVQELKADKAIDALKKMQITKVKVKREGKIFLINSEDVVQGDILILEAGDTIPADARIIWEAALKVDEASLTGESVPVTKTVEALQGEIPLSERNNMIYSGTNVVYGKCIAVVCETGMNTEFGMIAKSLENEEKDKTPLQKKIDGISKFLSVIILIIIAVMFVIGISKDMSIIEVFMLSISLAVAAIPEGLPAVITITLSLGMSAMAKKKAIVRKMSSVETLGCTDVICSDKTGTITQNKMQIREVVYNNKVYNVKDLEKNNLLFKSMILNNDVEKNQDDYVGDPTEIALYESLEDIVDINDIKRNNKRIDELPFDSERKMMSTLNMNNNEIIMYTKGSFDSVIECCDYYLENDKVKKLTEAKKRELKEIENAESNKAYRVLAFAYRLVEKPYRLDIDLENELIFLGMTAMIDPPRSDVKESIEMCKMAHIKPVMITGDSLSTAIAIAKEVGILENETEAITGTTLDNMTHEELKEVVGNYSVYARVSPMNKLAIVNAWKDNNKVVAMTGDGVNDAPALKVADIGVGMGITGTEVSKSVSDIVLADDSFSTIVTAVKEGRRIFDNIRNVLVYLLTGNIAEILVVFICMLFGVEIFLPIQLLYINLVTDSIPAIALTFEKEEKNIMNRAIRKKDSSFFTPFLLAKIGVASVLKAIAIILIYFINLKSFNVEVATTMAFLTLILLEMFYSFSCRNLKETVLDKNFFENNKLNISILFLTLIQIIIFVTPIKNIFGIVNINYSQIIYCIIIVLVTLIINELLKPIINRVFKD